MRLQGFMVLVLLDCGVGEESWESFGLKGGQTSQSQRKSTLNIHWDWCWRWSCSTLVIWCQEPNHWKRPCSWDRLKVGGERDNRRWGGWIASPTQWMRVWESSWSWWWTGKPGVLQSMGSQRVRHDWTELGQEKQQTPKGLCFITSSPYPWSSGHILTLLPWVGKIPWRRKWQSSPVCLPGKPHWQSSPRTTVHGIPKSRTWAHTHYGECKPGLVTHITQGSKTHNICEFLIPSLMCFKCRENTPISHATRGSSLKGFAAHTKGQFGCSPWCVDK